MMEFLEKLRSHTMLVLSRQRDESIIIGDNIVITVVDIRGDKVRLGINAPTEIPVHRQEVYEAIQRENQRAAGTGPDDAANLTNSKFPKGAKPWTWDRDFDVLRRIELATRFDMPRTTSLPLASLPVARNRQIANAKPRSRFYGSCSFSLVGFVELLSRQMEGLELQILRA
jgi:carbon storage regulator